MFKPWLLGLEIGLTALAVASFMVIAYKTEQLAIFIRDKNGKISPLKVIAIPIISFFVICVVVKAHNENISAPPPPKPKPSLRTDTGFTYNKYPPQQGSISNQANSFRNSKDTVNALPDSAVMNRSLEKSDTNISKPETNKVDKTVPIVARHTYKIPTLERALLDSGKNILFNRFDPNKIFKGGYDGSFFLTDDEPFWSMRLYI